MKLLPLSISLFLTGSIALFTAGITFADDSTMFRKNVSKTPELETEHAAIRMLPLYVPAHSSDGTLLTEGIDYFNADGTLVENREYVRPLIVHYNDGHVDLIEEDGYGGFPGHGQRDAYGAVSFDDGATWNRTNLSRSGDKYSIKLKDGKRKAPYYGDVLRSFAASDGNKVLVAWVSKYCGSGNPAYAITDEELPLLATYLVGTGAIVDEAACNDEDLATPCTYLEDAFAVAGSQGVQSADDLAEDGYPLVGDYPYSCAWAARGVVLPPASEGETATFSWFKAERLSSGVRDANRPEAVCVKGAGCVVTWQEDPDGIRPGHGDGPGEGWSGAIAHHQTDTWYTYIDWDDFDLVAGDDDEYGTFFNETGDLAEWLLANSSGSPKTAVPMSVPMRLTDNAMCKAMEGTDINEDSKPYCHIDFDGNGIADFCESTVSLSIETPEGPTQDVEMCITEDGRLMRGNTASTRARLGLHGYSTLGDYTVDTAAYPIDSAWFYMAYEENKGLGDICDDGDCEAEEMSEADKRDMGKNVWYHTFNMFEPELVSQGLMLNQPAVYPDEWSDPSGLLEAAALSGYNFWAFIEDPIYETQASIDTTTLYQSEIARRPSKISQDWYDAGPSGLVGLQLWKQGIIRRGGPADIFARRFVIPAGDGGGGTDFYQLCTTTYQVCTTTYEWCDACVDNFVNEDYNYNKGQCKKDPNQVLCFPYYYLDEDGNKVYTDEPQTCSSEPICESGLTSCPIDKVCEATTSCGDSQDFCPTDDLDENQYCEDATSCGMDAEDICPDNHADNQICTLIPGGDGGFDPTVDNPYEYANMECLDANGDPAWYFTDGSNSRYVKGLCAAPAINLSGNTVLLGETCTDATACFEAFPFNEYFDDLYMADTVEPISKILEWQQYGPDFGGTTITQEGAPDDGTNLNDQSWENPYDMGKGHRGFLAGDMVMMMYGWTNNWKALTDAHDIVNLYVRRSFDGGLTWSTLPGSFTHTDGIAYSGDGTTTCEWWVDGDDQSNEYPVCTDYGAGAFEQARNVSQLTGPHTTVLDPRFSPTTRGITEASVSTDSLPAGFTAPLYEDDTRNPTRFFMVYETGETSAYDAGEATPLDLYYSRAIDWGDDYLVWQDEANAECLPAADTEDEYDLTGFCNEFDAIEKSKTSESGEASVTASPGGQFFYATWNQWDFDFDGYEIGSDAWVRRILFLDEYVPVLTESN